MRGYRFRLLQDAFRYVAQTLSGDYITHKSKGIHEL